MVKAVKKSEYTPREAAYAIAATWLYLAFEGRTGDVDALLGSDAYKRAVRKQIAKLHNRLLMDSKLDGLALEME